MSFDRRRLAVATAGFCAFVNLYSPQALLPQLSREFGVGVVEISNVMTAGAAAIALTAPFTGAVADVLGRKRVIAVAMILSVVPTMLMAFVPNVSDMVVCRFVQGLLLPPVTAVTVAYIGDEWPRSQVAGVTGFYISGSAIGGFAGRFIPGIVADLAGWRAAFFTVAMVTLTAALIVTVLLPREKRFVRSEGLATSLRQMVRHLHNPKLLATYAVGFGVLFNFISTFTYVSFHLSAPPYNFSSTVLGSIFVTYLIGSLIVPFVGRPIARFGRRRFILGVIAVWICGAMLMLAQPAAVIIVGLTLCATCGMLCQTVSTGYVTLTAQEGRSSAVGLYVTTFYIGGTIGAFLPGIVYERAGWAACVALIVVMQLIMATIVALAWERSTT
jgi:predicted MFS family arabinose efflux permease